MRKFLCLAILFGSLFFGDHDAASQGGGGNISRFPPVPATSKPWVYWYWMNAAVSRYGIHQDLEAMKEAGIAGAYLMPINGAPDSLLLQPPVVQLSTAWWDMLGYAMQQADSLGIKLSMAVCDGFATAGGPWITPDLSMQKLVWSEIHVHGGTLLWDTLPQPEAFKGYYRDIAVYAFPSLKGAGISTLTEVPRVKTSIGGEAGFLAKKDNEINFVSHDSCWIDYQFSRPFTCRSIRIRVRGIAFQAYRLRVEISQDGKTFLPAAQLKPPRSGWEDYAVPEVTFSLRPVSARYFRFVFNPEGTKPGAEDLDAAKWKPTLKVCGIDLFSVPQIDDYQGKSGTVWRVSTRMDKNMLPDSLCVPLDQIRNITGLLDARGRLHWKVPPGSWTILRVGHTATGATNATGGGGWGAGTGMRQIQPPGGQVAI